jgi:hypothetical protein
MKMVNINDLATPFIDLAKDYGIIIRRRFTSPRSPHFDSELSTLHMTLSFTAKTRTVDIKYKLLLLMCGSGCEDVEMWAGRPGVFAAEMTSDCSDGSVWTWEHGRYSGNVDDALIVFRSLLEASKDMNKK